MFFACHSTRMASCWQPPKVSTVCKKCLPIALDVLLIVGAVAASYLLVPYLGYGAWSFSAISLGIVGLDSYALCSMRKTAKKLIGEPPQPSPAVSGIPLQLAASSKTDEAGPASSKGSNSLDDLSTTPITAVLTDPSPPPVIPPLPPEPSPEELKQRLHIQQLQQEADRLEAQVTTLSLTGGDGIGVAVYQANTALIAARQAMGYELPKTVRYEYQPSPPPTIKLPTTFSVERMDTTQVALQNPHLPWCLLNLANNYKAGGGYETGNTTQEEELCRLILALYGSLDAATKEGLYPINANSTDPATLPPACALYTPNLYIERYCKQSTTPYQRIAHNPAQPTAHRGVPVSVLSSALFDLRVKNDGRGSDLEDLGLRKQGIAPGSPHFEENLRANAPYMEGTRNRIRALLGAAKARREKNLVLGAWGCGCFANPIAIVTDLFKEAFESAEFKGAFANVRFAILTNNPSNVSVVAFSGLCRELQASQHPPAPKAT